MPDCLTRRELDAAEWQTLGVHGGPSIRLAPPCHPRAGLVVTYASEEGCLRLTCRQCAQLMCVVVVADGATVH